MQILTEEIQTVSIKVSSVKVSSINIIARDKEAFHCQETMMIVDLDPELIIVMVTRQLKFHICIS